MKSGARASGRASRPIGASLEYEAFHGLPHALVVLDRDGAVLSCNPQAERLVRASELPRAALRCCTLVGCRQPGTALSGGCIAELAIASTTSLPEARVELASCDGQVPVWITASAIGVERARVVLALRAGASSDGRLEADASWADSVRLRISTLGSTVVEARDGSIGGDWLDQRTGQLLKYLVAERHRAVPVDAIGESIWPGAEYAVSASVRYYVHLLRRRLEPERAVREQSAFIIARSGTYRLKLDHVEIDADEFESCVNAGLAMVGADAQRAAEEIERGLALYRGDFLAELPYADWAMSERNRLHGLACLGLSKLADIRLEGRAIDSAARCLERLGALQPYDEDVHRRLIELDIIRGRRSDAVRRYAALRSRIRRTFGHDPGFTPADIAHPQL
jgi:DNA-binding SARP family transcriptional activator